MLFLSSAPRPPAARGRYVHEHQLRKAEEGVERSTLRPCGVQLLGNAVNVIIEVGIGLGVVGLVHFATESGPKQFAPTCGKDTPRPAWRGVDPSQVLQTAD